MRKTTKPDPKHYGAVYNVASIFAAHRDLRPEGKLWVQGLGLSPEECDILIALYGARHLGWDDCVVYEDGWVNFKSLKSILVNDPGLFARRISKLRKRKLVSVRSGREAGAGLHGKAMQARIEDVGKAVVTPVWERYTQFAEQLLTDFSAAELKTHQRVNEAVSRILRARRAAKTQ